MSIYDELGNTLVDIARTQTSTLAAADRLATQIEQHIAASRSLRAHNTKLLKALMELEDILEDRYDGPEDTTNGPLLQIVKQALRS